MASLNEPANLRIVAEDPNGNQFVVRTFRSDSAVNAGKSPDGVLANLTIDKQLRMGLAGPVLMGGWRVRLLAQLDAADGLDVSDGVFQIPMTLSDGTEKTLGASELQISTDYPAATPAGHWIEIGKGYTLPDGQRARIGSASGLSPVVISLEDDS
jgi:hypothetical protein